MLQLLWLQLLLLLLLLCNQCQLLDALLATIELTNMLLRRYLVLLNRTRTRAMQTMRARLGIGYFLGARAVGIVVVIVIVVATVAVQAASYVSIEFLPGQPRRTLLGFSYEILLFFFLAGVDFFLNLIRAFPRESPLACNLLLLFLE